MDGVRSWDLTLAVVLDFMLGDQLAKHAFQFGDPATNRFFTS